MLNVILIVVAVILLTIGLVWLVDKFIPTKFKPILIAILWILIAFLGYQTFMSIYNPIKFIKVRNERYVEVIERLIDIRDSQLAHRQVTGRFSPNFESLVKFIDTAQFTITQRRDSLILDEEATKRFGGVTTMKEIIIIDTLDFVSVRDSLFKTSDRYKTMMNIPFAKESTKFEMKSGLIEQNQFQIPVFEAKVKKNIILFDQERDLVIQENQVIAVDGVNGKYLSVGSMDEVRTNGNWPKTYGENE